MISGDEREEVSSSSPGSDGVTASQLLINGAVGSFSEVSRDGVASTEGVDSKEGVDRTDGGDTADGGGSLDGEDSADGGDSPAGEEPI